MSSGTPVIMQQHAQHAHRADLVREFVVFVGQVKEVALQIIQEIPVIHKLHYYLDGQDKSRPAISIGLNEVLSHLNQFRDDCKKS